MPSPRRRPLAVAALLTAGLLAGGALAPVASAVPLAGAPCLGPSDVGASAPAPIASSNVQFLCNFPDTAFISGTFSNDGRYFYVSSTDSITVYDAKVPERPVALGTLGNLVFENEAMSYGEQRAADGTLTRFVLVGVDLVENDPTAAPTHVATGKQVLVIDVTDPSNPHQLGRTPDSSSAPGYVTTSSHTVQCVDSANCTVAYTAGGRAGTFSVVDLTDLTKPAQVKEVASPAAGPNAVFRTGAGHYWDFDGTGIGWHTGSGGAAAFDVTDPLNPVPVQATNDKGVATPYNDFILHNSFRPNADRFVPNATPSLANGNVLLVTEEDYFNNGDEVACDKAGSFETWYVPNLDGPAYRAGNPQGKPSQGTIAPLDIINPVAESPAGSGYAPVGGFCSAHWFDYNQDGFVAEGFYQQGLRILDVRDPMDIKQYGYYTTQASEVWDAYWVPERDANGVPTGRKTNVVYVADFAHGFDVVRVTLPDAGPSADVPEVPVAVLLPLAALVVGSAVVVRRRRTA